MVTLFLRQGENGKQVLLSFPATTPAEKADVAATMESLKSMSKTVTIQGAASEVMNLGLYLSGVDLAAEGEVERINQLAERLEHMSEVDCTLDVEHESLFELNRLCHACSNFKEQDFVKLGAVCQMAKPTCAANIRQLAENLDQFDFAPNVHTPEELGKYMIQQSGHYEYDENLEDFYNYGDYGVKRILQDDGVFVDRGYVSYHGTLTLDELMRDDPAESYQQEQEAKMEGMTW